MQPLEDSCLCSLHDVTGRKVGGNLQLPTTSNTKHAISLPRWFISPACRACLPCTRRRVHAPSCGRWRLQAEGQGKCAYTEAARQRLLRLPFVAAAPLSMVPVAPTARLYAAFQHNRQLSPHRMFHAALRAPLWTTERTETPADRENAAPQHCALLNSCWGRRHDSTFASLYLITCHPTFMTCAISLKHAQGTNLSIINNSK